MKSTLKILWIEDEDDFFDDNSKKIIKHFDKEVGIAFEIKRPNKTELTAVVKDTMLYDLVFSDFDLSLMTPDLNGKKLIKELRKTNKFVDVIFYSQKAIDGKDVDIYNEGGIFVSPKASFLADSIELIAYYTSKIFDMSRARGEVTAFVAEFDDIQARILLDLFEHNQEILTEFKREIKSDVEDDFKLVKKAKELKKIDDLDLMKVQDLRRYVLKIPADRRRRAIRRLHPHIGDEIAGHSIKVWQEYLDNFQKKILDTRNKLAHCRVISKGTKEILIDTLDNDKELDYDLKKLIDISKDISMYMSFFSDVHGRITKHVKK